MISRFIIQKPYHIHSLSNSFHIVRKLTTFQSPLLQKTLKNKNLPYPQLTTDLKQIIFPSSNAFIDDDLEDEMVITRKKINNFKDYKSMIDFSAKFNKLTDPEVLNITNHLDELTSDTTDWNSLPLHIKRLQYYIAFGPLGPRSKEYFKNLENPLKAPDSKQIFQNEYMKLDPMTIMVLGLAGVILTGAAIKLAFDEYVKRQDTEEKETTID